MKRRVSTIKVLFFLGAFCVTMWRMPDLVGAVDGAKGGDLTKLLQMFGAGPSSATAAPVEQNPERLNELLGEIGVPAVGSNPEDGNAKSSGPPILITPDSEMTPEQARALVDQQRREALERSGKRKPS